jgi:hypothetical protein
LIKLPAEAKWDRLVERDRGALDLTDAEELDVRLDGPGVGIRPPSCANFVAMWQLGNDPVPVN